MSKGKAFSSLFVVNFVIVTIGRLEILQKKKKKIFYIKKKTGSHTTPVDAVGSLGLSDGIIWS